MRLLVLNGGNFLPPSVYSSKSSLAERKEQLHCNHNLLLSIDDSRLGKAGSPYPNEPGQSALSF